jgi:hypothetical protein
MPFLQAALIAGAGAAFQELLHWYELREHLDDEKYRKLLRSTSYWAVTLLMTTSSGAGTAMFYGDSITMPSALALLGAGFPLLFKRLVSATVDQRAKLGGPAPGPVSTVPEPAASEAARTGGSASVTPLNATPLRWYFLGRWADAP